METEYIKLGIAGNPYSNGGHQPLISIGYEDAVLRKDIVFPSPVKSDFFIQFMQTEEEMQYTYVADPNTIHSIGASRAGSLWISITVPKGISIKGYTPYTLLMKIVDMFHRHYMTQRSDGSYEFRPGNYDRKVFVDFIAQLETEDYKGRYVAMTGDRPGAVAVGDEMEEFFADPQYPEFSNYSKIIVAKEVDGSKIAVGIPRPVNYTVYYGVKEIGTITSKTEVFKYTFISPDVYHEDSTVEFSLADNDQSAKNYRLQIDESNESVYVTPMLPQKKIKVIVDFGSQSKNVIDSLGFHFEVNGEPKYLSTDENGKFYADFLGEEKKSATKENLKYTKNKELTVNIKNLAEKDTFEVSITQKPKIESIKLIGKISEKATLHLSLSDGSKLSLDVEEGEGQRIVIPKAILYENLVSAVLASAYGNYKYTITNHGLVSGNILIFKVTEEKIKVESKPTVPSDRQSDKEKKEQQSSTIKLINDTDSKLKEIWLYIELENDNYLPIMKEVTYGSNSFESYTFTLEQEDLKQKKSSRWFSRLSGKAKDSNNDSSGKKKLLTKAISVIFAIALIVTGAIIIGKKLSQPDAYQQIAGLLKDIPDIQCESQTGNIFILNNWDYIFDKYTKTQNSSYLTAKEKLDSANSIISRYKASNKAALKKGKKKQIETLKAMTYLYKDKKQSYDTVKINVERQIKHFSKLMTDLKVKDYEFRFDDAYKIGEWLDKADNCNLVDTRDEDYKFVKDCNQYYVDFVKILVNNDLKRNLSNIDKYTDNNKIYKINKDLYYDKNFKIIDNVNDSMYRAELQAFRYYCLELFGFDKFAQKRSLHRVLLRDDAYKYFYDIDTFIDIKSGYMRY